MDSVFKKKVGVLGTAAFLSLSVLAGCGGSETEETETEETNMETEETNMETEETEEAE